MGGGGLDYYDTAMLVRAGRHDAPDPRLPRRSRRRRRPWRRPRPSSTPFVGTPEGMAKRPDGRPEAAAVPGRSMNRLQGELLALTDPAEAVTVALGVRDAKTVGDTEVRIRGEAEKLGPMVPRVPADARVCPSSPTVNPEQSGRLELAAWLTSAKNPLTPRVIVNRVWQHLFGQGLVTTVDNFGVTGDQPSHPELLDHLANRFIRDGWSVKKLVRELVLSRAYQLGSEAPAAAMTLDPANRLVWRHSPATARAPRRSATRCSPRRDSST